VQRHLATLESSGNLLASAGALGAAACGLALGGLTAANAGLGLVCTLSRAQIMVLDDVSHVFATPLQLLQR